jgi:hypothetical protein
MPRKGHAVLGTWVDALSWDDAIEQVAAWCTLQTQT